MKKKISIFLLFITTLVFLSLLTGCGKKKELHELYFTVDEPVIGMAADDSSYSMAYRTDGAIVASPAYWTEDGMRVSMFRPGRTYTMVVDSVNAYDGYKLMPDLTVYVNDKPAVCVVDEENNRASFQWTYPQMPEGHLLEIFSTYPNTGTMLEDVEFGVLLDEQPLDFEFTWNVHTEEGVRDQELGETFLANHTYSADVSYCLPQDITLDDDDLYFAVGTFVGENNGTALIDPDTNKVCTNVLFEIPTMVVSIDVTVPEPGDTVGSVEYSTLLTTDLSQQKTPDTALQCLAYEMKDGLYRSWIMGQNETFVNSAGKPENSTQYRMRFDVPVESIESVDDVYYLIVGDLIADYAEYDTDKQILSIYSENFELGRSFDVTINADRPIGNDLISPPDMTVETEVGSGVVLNQEWMIRDQDAGYDVPKENSIFEYDGDWTYYLHAEFRLPEQIKPFNTINLDLPEGFSLENLIELDDGYAVILRCDLLAPDTHKIDVTGSLPLGGFPTDGTYSMDVSCDDAPVEVIGITAALEEPETLGPEYQNGALWPSGNYLMTISCKLDESIKSPSNLKCSVPPLFEAQGVALVDDHWEIYLTFHPAPPVFVVHMDQPMAGENSADKTATIDLCYYANNDEKVTDTFTCTVQGIEWSQAYGTGESGLLEFSPFSGVFTRGNTYRAEVRFLPDEDIKAVDKAVIYDGPVDYSRGIGGSDEYWVAELEFPIDGNSQNSQTEEHTHVWTYDYTEREATYTEKGCDIYRCGICGETKTVDTDIVPHEHSWKFDATELAATYTAGGRDRYRCELCGETKTVDTDIVPHEHSWTYDGPVTAATCTSGGRDKYHCALCGETKEVDTSALGHSVDEWLPSDVEGQHYGICSHCGEEFTESCCDFTYPLHNGDTHERVCGVCGAVVWESCTFEQNPSATSGRISWICVYCGNVLVN